jgi:hypothetical protein
MERDYTCVGCRKAFTIRNQSPQTVAPGEAKIIVACPLCGTANAIEWPLDSRRFLIVPKGLND